MSCGEPSEATAEFVVDIVGPLLGVPKRSGAFDAELLERLLDVFDALFGYIEIGFLEAVEELD